MFCIDHDRERLYERINERVDMMMREGLCDEVRRLMDMGYSPALNSMKAIGYKEIIDYFNGMCSLEEAAEAIKQNSRRYAKRQLTWFRRDERRIKLSPDSAVWTAVEEIKSRHLGIAE